MPWGTNWEPLATNVRGAFVAIQGTRRRRSSHHIYTISSLEELSRGLARDRGVLNGPEYQSSKKECTVGQTTASSDKPMAVRLFRFRSYATTTQNGASK